MNTALKTLMVANDLAGINRILTANPVLANEGMPYDEANPASAHPLHRVCDLVFNHTISDEEAVEIAKLFLKHGALVNGNGFAYKKDTPLVAAASLNADKVGLLYIDNGADVSHAGCHGGTALHWAAWCGRPVLVNKLIAAGAPVNQKCIDFHSTPVFWAIHGFESGSFANVPDYFECVRLLMNAGGDSSIPNADGNTVYDLLQDKFPGITQLLQNQSL